MKRIITVLTIAALMAVMMVAGAGYAFAYANPDNQGNASNAPGQENAIENCVQNIEKQTENDVSAGGGPKEDVPAPTNCDKFFPPPGQEEP
jgi:hypothetical protein